MTIRSCSIASGKFKGNQNESSQTVEDVAGGNGVGDRVQRHWGGDMAAGVRAAAGKSERVVVSCAGRISCDCMAAAERVSTRDLPDDGDAAGLRGDRYSRQRTGHQVHRVLPNAAKGETMTGRGY
jgi:hypothetical protein